jgi:hypothetical protein
MFISSDGGQDAGVSTLLPKSSVVVAWETEGCVGSTTAMVIDKRSDRNVNGAERGMISMLEGLVKIIVTW